MWIYFIFAAGLGILFMMAAGTELPQDMEVKRWQKPFYQCGCFLIEHLERVGKPITEKQRYQLTLEKAAYVFMILFVGLGCAVAIEAAYGSGQLLLEKTQLQRPDQGMGAQVQELQVQVEDMTEVEDIRIDLKERAYTEAEKRALLEEAVSTLDTIVPGTNASVDEVRGKVELPTELLEGRVKAAWFQEPMGLLDNEGNITEELKSEGEILELKAILTCEDQEMEYRLALHLMPKIRTPWETLMHELQGKLREEQEKTADQEKLPLPQEVDGHRLIWMTPAHSFAGICVGVTILAAAFLWIGKEQEYRNMKKQQRRQMILDYPDILFKLGMLLNAGLTMQSAFRKVAMEYRQRRERQKTGKRSKKTIERFAYEQMLTACYEMQSGVPESRAYENFGHRCGTAGYIKLGTLLSGGLQKGSEGLTKILLEEAMLSMEERRQAAKQFGEEAGTKLLLPMTGMLLVVLAVLMMPAMMAF
ncbi:MAG: hypothetical protein Q4B57_06030 [Eubacteriales bacterium]|nr:hypothetical protein [Eubacteriales bacterium]